MTKWFSTLFITSFLLTSCFDPEDELKKQDSKTTTQQTASQETKQEETKAKKETNIIEAGFYNLAIAGSDFLKIGKGKSFYDGIKRFTQDIVTSEIGKDFSSNGKVILRRAQDKWEYQSDKETISFEDKLNKFSKYKLDSLFVKVEDKIHNNSKVYNLLKKEKLLENTKIFMVGEENKSSLVKKFAGDNISTGIYNKNIASYIAGFQSAVGSIKFSTSNKEFLETKTSFLIGSVDNADDRRKANAFRRGVIAASKHSSYKDFLSIDFIDKDLDPSEENLLSYSVANWKNNNRLFSIASKSSFNDNDHQVIYIAGTNAKDWRGTSSNDDLDLVDTNDNLGLIGSLYNYKNITSNGTNYDDLKQWNFDNNIALILDDFTNQKNQDNSIEGDKTTIKRHNLKLMGSIGDENLGNWAYAQLAIKGLYLGFTKNDYYLKHFIFGAPLNIHNNNVFEQSGYDFSYDSSFADQTFRPSFWEIYKWNYDVNKLTTNTENWLGK